MGSENSEQKFILVVEDDRGTCRLVETLLKKAGFASFCCHDGVSALNIIKRQPVDLVITDYQMPGMDGLELLKTARESGSKVPFILITAHGCVETTWRALELGASAFLTKPLDPDAIIAKVTNILSQGSKLTSMRYLKAETPGKLRGVTLIGKSPAMANICEHIHKASLCDANVLITGESGTGKELAARAIHSNSRRKDGPFIAVNCSVFSRGVLESELFGHVKGAFTDALKDRKGRFELADGGSLFIDEIGDAPLDIQVKLLRVIQEKQFERVGGIKTVFSDFRLIAATNKNLKAMIKGGAFREDLYYRLNVINIDMPPLKKRMEDIPELLKHFLHYYNGVYGKNIMTLSVDAIKLIQKNRWNGNVRQLENAVESAVALCDRDMIDVEHLPLEIQDLTHSPVAHHITAGSEGESLPEAVAALEKQMIRTALKRHNGIKARAARALGIQERRLAYKMTKYGIVPG